MNKISVVIPIYKIIPDEIEIISLKRVYEILGGKYDISFVCPENLDIINYEKISEDFTIKNIQIKRLPNSFFSDIQAYNRLMLNIDFYKQFLQYQYILIYQLDCYVFRDELEYWRKQGYDYIGAPFLDYKYYNLSRINKVKFLVKQFLHRMMGKEISYDSILYKSGNGGFSLRKVDKFYKLLQLISSERKEKYMSSLSSDLRNEDTFYTYEVNRYYHRLRIPNYKIASRFSLEWNPQIGMKINKGKLPFGCHAWNKKIEFWKKYIEL